jgi:hypothetical protein
LIKTRQFRKTPDHEHFHVFKNKSKRGVVDNWNGLWARIYHMVGLYEAKKVREELITSRSAEFDGIEFESKKPCGWVTSFDEVCIHAREKFSGSPTIRKVKTLTKELRVLVINQTSSAHCRLSVSTKLLGIDRLQLRLPGSVLPLF